MQCCVDGIKRCGVQDKYPAVSWCFLECDMEEVRMNILTDLNYLHVGVITNSIISASGNLPTRVRKSSPFRGVAG